MNTFNWAIIGTGAIARKVAKEIVRTGRHEIVSVYSRTRSKAEDFARRYGAKVFDTFDEAVTYEEVDGVYLATPHSCHYREILRCIELGVPVLSEKAFTINSGQNEEILKKNRSSYVSEGMWTRYNPITKKIRDIIDGGELGKILSFDASFCYDYRLSGFSDRVLKKEYGGGALLDVGVYPISYATMLFGVPSHVESKMKFNKYGVDSSDDITLSYGDGPTCHIRCAIDHLSTCSATIKGEKGSIYIPLFYRPNIAFLKIGKRRSTIQSKAGYIHEFDKVASDIVEGALESEEITLEDSLRIMKILDSIRLSHHLTYGDIEDI